LPVCRTTPRDRSIAADETGFKPATPNHPAQQPDGYPRCQQTPDLLAGAVTDHPT
jgi:hypothetical protein